MIRRSYPEDARRLDCIGENLTLWTSFVWPRRLNNLLRTLRMSHTATVESADPVMTMNSLKGDVSTLMIS